MENWKDVEGCDRWYEVSNYGRVRFKTIGCGRPQILRPWVQNGYPMVHLQSENGTQKKYVHRLIADAFLGPCPDGCVVHHKDEDRTNAHVDNLEYVTRSKHRHHHHIMACLRIEPIGPGGGLTMFD